MSWQCHAVGTLYILFIVSFGSTFSVWHVLVPEKKENSLKVIARRLPSHVAPIAEHKTASMMQALSASPDHFRSKEI